jgi:hypothetical protein
VKRAAVFVVALTGCDNLFGIKAVPPLPGEAGVTADATPAIDGPMRCTPINHDEDGDGRDDACDSCPTVIELDADSDNDGLDNACDPSPTEQNKILFMTGFPSMADLDANFTYTNASWAAINNGQLTMFGSSIVTTKGTYAPVKIEVRTSQVGEGLGVAANVNHSVASCILYGGSCDNTTTTRACIKGVPGTAQGELSIRPANIKLVELSGSPITCSMSASNVGPASATTTQTFQSTVLQFTTNAGSAMIIDSVVIYGVKQ